ncbi:MAG: hypothetical protein IH600_04865, partial [Bacteroidetes bacterium]|nr:hypothetical protein [Bacteroidota bacterium]
MASSAAIVASLIIPRSATMQMRPIPKRSLSHVATGISEATSAVLPGHISEQTGLPLIVEDHADDHLRGFGTMILRMIASADLLASGTIEVHRRRIEKHERHLAEESSLSVVFLGEQVRHRMCNSRVEMSGYMQSRNVRTIRHNDS